MRPKGRPEGECRSAQREGTPLRAHPVSRPPWTALRVVALPLAACVVVGGCTVMPTAPTVTSLPGSRKTVDQYQVDVAACQQHAAAVVAASSGGTAAVADNNAAATAVAGSLLGAATGAIIGAATGNAGQGAAIGAGTGLLFGGLSGSNYTLASSSQLQWTFDNAYLQCMYSRGNRVPAGFVAVQRRDAVPYASAPTAPPRFPPPNTPPPAGVTGSTGSGTTAPPATTLRPAPSTYPAPSGIPPSSYPPPDAPPPANLPPRN